MLRPDKQVQRTQTSSQRRPPHQPVIVEVPFEGSDEIAVGLPAAPLQLNIMATDHTGETAPWFDDTWWTELIARYADDTLSIVMAATPSALLHPIVLHHLEMLFRVVPGWRIAGYAFVDDLQTNEEWEQAARSPYHELRIVDRLRNPALASRIEVRPVEEVIGAIRAAQQRMSATRPVLTRMPGDTIVPGEVNTPAVPAAPQSSALAEYKPSLFA